MGINNFCKMKTTIILVVLLCYLLFVVYSHEGCGLKYLKTPRRKYISSNNDNEFKSSNGNSKTDKISYRKGPKNSMKENIQDEWSPIKIQLDFSGIENNIQKFNTTDLKYLRENIMSK